MHKTDLVAAVAEHTGLSRNQADAVVSAALELMTNALSRHEPVALLGFGRFTTPLRPARTGRNPQDGSPLAIAAGYQVLFRPGKALKAAVQSVP